MAKKAEDLKDEPRKIVYANTTCVVVSSGTSYALTRGDAWDPESRVVESRPDLFDDEPPIIRGIDEHTGFVVNRVEETTARPGERRNVRRPRS